MSEWMRRRAMVGLASRSAVSYTTFLQRSGTPLIGAGRQNWIVFRFGSVPSLFLASLGSHSLLVKTRPIKATHPYRATTMTAPKKYIKVGGVMKLNPEFARYQSGGSAPPTSVARPDVALPVVSTMDDYARFNQDLNMEIPMAEATSAAIEHFQEPEICLATGSEYCTWCMRSSCSVLLCSGIVLCSLAEQKK